MKPGSVVVDLAAETGGNVEGSVPGEVVRIGNAQVWGGDNVPAPDARPGLQALRPERRQPRHPDDPRGGGRGGSPPTSRTRSSPAACVTHDGRIRHEPTREAILGTTEEATP